MIEVDTDKNNFGTGRHVICSPERSWHDLKVRPSLLPSVGELKIGIEPAIPLRAHQAGTGTKGGEQTVAVKGAVGAENDGGNAIFLGFGRVRLSQLLGVAMVSRGSGGIVQVGIEDQPWVNGTISDHYDSGTGVHSANGCDDALGFGSINQIGLGNKDEVSKLDLVHE